VWSEGLCKLIKCIYFPNPFSPSITHSLSLSLCRETIPVCVRAIWNIVCGADVQLQCIPVGGTYRMTEFQGLTIAQAVSRWCFNLVTRLWAQGRSCGICARQSGTGAGFRQVIQFLLPIIPLDVPHSLSWIIRGWYNRPDGDRRTKWTQSHTELRGP
jgi:hypothetical protein